MKMKVSAGSWCHLACYIFWGLVHDKKPEEKRPFFDFCVLSSFLQCSMAILTEKKRLVVIQCGHKDLLGIFPDCYYYYKSIIVNLGFYNQVHRLLSDLGCKIHLSTIKHAENLLLCYLLTKKRFVHAVQCITSQWRWWLNCVTFAFWLLIIVLSQLQYNLLYLSSYRMYCSISLIGFLSGVCSPRVT